ncbi:MAG: hypothetical protein ACXABY_20310 [Candidatus Thorarchaeota archaeon]|jgi:hypothetical protein
MALLVLGSIMFHVDPAYVFIYLIICIGAGCVFPEHVQLGYPFTRSKKGD